MDGTVQNRKRDLTRRVFLLLAGWLVAVAAVGGVFALYPYVLPGQRVIKWIALHFLCALILSAFVRVASRGREGWRWQCLLAFLLAVPPLMGYLGSFTELANPPLLNPLMSFHSALLLARPIWLWFAACVLGSCWRAPAKPASPAKGVAIALAALALGCAAIALSPDLTAAFVRGYHFPLWGVYLARPGLLVSGFLGGVSGRLLSRCPAKRAVRVLAVAAVALACALVALSGQAQGAALALLLFGSWYLFL